MRFVFRSLLLLVNCFFVFLPVHAQQADSLQPSFSFAQQRINDSTVELIATARIKPGTRLFSAKPASPDHPATSFSFDSSASYHPQELVEKGNRQTVTDPNFEGDLGFFTDSVAFVIPVIMRSADTAVVNGAVSYLVQRGDEYIAGDEPFNYIVQPTTEKVEAETADSQEAAKTSLLMIFLAAFGGGLLALLTPCVYSMIPVTVSYFTKRSATRQQGVRNALWYASSIVFIFTLLGFLITVIFGPAALNNLATNWLANLLFFAVFLIFGISFLGAFDINLPASWSAGADSKAGLKSSGGIFFMALTLVLVSFSCTGPIIGNLLVLAARGNWYGPLVGMFGFSLALALPFALFAFFPSRLTVLGKAGGWLNVVKVTLGFLELALALKFLSNADLVRGWRLLDREVFLVLWIVIFLALGLYLLGKLRFHHDDDLPKNDFGLPYLSVTRLFFAMGSLAFALYMVPGLWGAPLKKIAAFVPPMGTQDFVLGSVGSIAPAYGAGESTLPPPRKYYEQMHIYEPEVVKKFGMITYFDLEEAKAVSRQTGRPIMLDFTGINCANCRKMEAEVWSDPQVMQRLKDNFVIASLYVDVQNIYLPQEEQFFSEALGKKVLSLGDKHADYQVKQYNANSQPFYFFIDAEEKRLIKDGYGYNPDVPAFVNLLDSAVAAHQMK